MALPPAAAAADAAAHLFDGLWKHLIDGGQSLEEARGKRKSHTRLQYGSDTHK